MNVRRSLLGLTFCTCYLASHLINKVSRRAGATARGLRACGPRPRSCPGLAGLDGTVKETDSERKHSESTSRNFVLNWEDHLLLEAGDVAWRRAQSPGLHLLHS